MPVPVPAPIPIKLDLLDDELAAPHRHLPVRAGADEPGLARYPAQCEHSQPVAHGVPAQDLEGHDERVRH